MKKTWEAPKLIVLVRSRPEESLTSGCKGTAFPGGPNANATLCYSGGPTACTPCIAYADS
jgi:hypothetical protein